MGNIEQFAFLEELFDLPEIFGNKELIKLVENRVRMNDSEKIEWKDLTSGWKKLDKNNSYQFVGFWKKLVEKVEESKGDNRIALRYLANTKYALCLGGLGSYNMEDSDHLVHSEIFMLSAKHFAKAEKLVGYFGRQALRLCEVVGLAAEYKEKAGEKEEGKYLKDMSARFIRSCFQNPLTVDVRAISKKDMSNGNKEGFSI